MNNNEKIRIGSRVKCFSKDLNETIEIMVVPADYESDKCKKLSAQKINMPLAKALMGAQKGDRLWIYDNSPDEIHVLEVYNSPLSELLKYYYSVELEGKLLHNDKNINPFPFKKRLYIGFKNKHICQGGQSSWEIAQCYLYHKEEKKQKNINICKCCGMALLEGMPYNESSDLQFYRLYDLNDGQRLNKKEPNKGGKIPMLGFLIFFF